MTAQEVFNLIKGIKPGVWKIGLTYQKDLPILKGRGKGMSPAEAAGIAQGDLYKVVFRWCSANVNRENTKAAIDAKAARDAKIANGETVRTAPSGFHKSDVADELNIIEYRDGTDEPCLIFKKGPHPDKVQYFLKGQEISQEDIEQFVEQKVVSKTVLHELAVNEVFYLYPDKVQSLKIDGILHEEWENNMNEAMFNGIALPNEDGFMDVEEELCEACEDALVSDSDSPEKSAQQTADYFKQEKQKDKEFAKQLAADADAGDPSALYFRNKFSKNQENIDEDFANGIVYDERDRQGELARKSNENLEEATCNETTSTGKYNMKQAGYPNKSHPGSSIVSGSTNETDPHEKVADRLLRIIKGAGVNGIPRKDALELAGYNKDLADRYGVGNSIFNKLQNQGLIRVDKDMLYINESLDEGARAKYVANQLDAASRFKQDFHSHDTDRLAQRKPGSFAKEELNEATGNCTWTLTDDSDSDYYDNSYEFKYRLNKNCPQYQKIIEDLLAIFNDGAEPEDQCTLEDVPNGCEITASGHLSTDEYDSDSYRLEEITLPDICWDPLVEVQYTKYGPDQTVDEFLKAHGLNPEELNDQFYDDMHNEEREIADDRSARAYDNAVWKHMVGINAGLNTSKQSATKITEAMNREARKNGYRNYKEYLNSNK